MATEFREDQRQSLEDSQLPPLEAAASPPGLHILMDGVVDYPTASHFLERELVGRTLIGGDHAIRITALDLTGTGNGRLALQIDFDGDARGRVFFVGTPVFDARSGQIHVPDLDFDLASSSLLIEGLVWLKHQDFVAGIRERAHFPVGRAIAEGRRLLLEGLNRDLSDDVRLSGEVVSVTPIGVYPTAQRLHVRTHAVATARLVVR